MRAARRLTVPWLRIVWEIWRFRVLSDDEGSYYVKWTGRPRLLRLRGKRSNLRMPSRSAGAEGPPPY
jgi:hypothetical protein